MIAELCSRGAVPGEEEISEVFVIGSAFSGNDGALDAIDENYDWIEFDTGDPEKDQDLRMLRLEAAKLTAASCRLGRYSFNEADIPLVNLPQTLEGTHVVINVDGTTQQEQRYNTEFNFHEADDASFTELLLGLAAERSVTVLSASSPYKVGGNFSEGGAAELEELLCMQSTLQMSLRRAGKMASEHGVTAPTKAGPSDSRATWDVHIPEYGAIISPNVEIFRGGPEYGFPFLEGPLVLAAIISIAMPNCNQDLRDEPCDAPESPEEYHRQLHAKIAAALEVAVAIQCRTLVVPPLGCGRYLNDPSTVGKVFVEVFQSRFSTAFAEVHFFGDDDFLVACSSCSSIEQGAGLGTGLPEPEELAVPRMRERRNAVDVAEQRAWAQEAETLAQEPGESETLLDPEDAPALLGSALDLSPGHPRQRPSALDSSSDSQGSEADRVASRSQDALFSEERLREERFQSLKSTVVKVAAQHQESLETLQASLSSLLTEQTVREEHEALRRQAVAIQDESTAIDAQRQELEEKTAELAATKEELLRQLDTARKLAASGCRMS